MLKKKYKATIFCSIILSSFLLTTIRTHPHESLIASEVLTIDQPFFVITVASRNNSKYYKKNLDSILQQNYPYFHVIYTDDASTDNTADLVEKYVQQCNMKKKVTLIRNKTRRKPLANHYTMNHMIHPKAITVIMDGDDWFKHTNVLSKLAKVYSDGNIWMTYGSWEEHPTGRIPKLQPYDSNIIKENSYRKHRYWGNPLRSFYSVLFQKINKKDFLHDGVNFFPMATDPAFMFPLLEMCGNHALFIDEILYVYNKDRKSDTNLRQLGKYMKQIRSKKPYKRLNHLL